MLDEISFWPNSSKDLEIFVINFSTVSVSRGRFFKAMYIDFASLSLSKGDFLPFFLTTIISLNCTLSKVVNLSPQIHYLLLLIVVPSSVGLESTTDVSPFLQIGQIIYLS